VSDSISPANGTLSSGAVTVTFAARYSYAEIWNGGTTFWYARADGQTPASPWTDCYIVAPGQRALVPSGAPLWYQGYNSPDGPDPQTNPGLTVAIVASDTTTDASAHYEIVGV
jgi:hypothetical protein